MVLKYCNSSIELLISFQHKTFLNCILMSFNWSVIMELYRNKLNYLKDLQRNKIDHGDILAIRIARILSFVFSIHLSRKTIYYSNISKTIILPCRYGHSWWTQDAYIKSTKLSKVIYIVANSYLLFISVTSLLNAILNPKSLPSRAYLLENISFTSISVIATYIVACANWRRKSFSEVLRIVNEKNWDLLKSDQKEKKYREKRNTIHLYSIGICVGLHVILGFVWLSFIVQYLIMDRKQYKIYLKTIPILYNLQLVAQLFVLLWICMHLSGWFPLMADIFLRLRLYYHILGDRLRGLRGWGPDTTKETIMSELNLIIFDLRQLDTIMEELNSVFRVYIPPVIGVTIYSTGLYIANLFTARSLSEALYFVIYPVWQISYLGLLCYMGQLIKDAVSWVRKGGIINNQLMGILGCNDPRSCLFV